MNVEVELQNHPLYDGLEVKLERLKTRQTGQPHPSWWVRRVSAVPDGDDRVHEGADPAAKALRFDRGEWRLPRVNLRVRLSVTP